MASAPHPPSRAAAAAAAADPAPRPQVWGSVKRAFGSFRGHGMTDWAAALTYYLVMSLFPALLVGVSLLGLFGQQSLVTDAVNYLRDAGAPKAAVDAVR